MPIEIEYDSTIDTIIMRSIGKITYDDVTDLAEKIIAHPDFRVNIKQLFDITNGEFDLETDEIERIARKYTSESELFGHERRYAIVVSRVVDFGMVNQYKVFFQPGPGVETCGFRSLEEARHWLQEK